MHLRQSEISKIFPGVIPGLRIKGEGSGRRNGRGTGMGWDWRWRGGGGSGRRESGRVGVSGGIGEGRLNRPHAKFLDPPLVSCSDVVLEARPRPRGPRGQNLWPCPLPWPREVWP